jgi:ribonuclease VapC
MPIRTSGSTTNGVYRTDVVVDTSALVAVLLDEPESERFMEVIALDEHSVIGAPTLLETSMVLSDRKGVHGVASLRRFVRRFRLAVEPFRSADCRVAVRAFLVYGKGRHPARLNFGDCMAYAVAKNRRQKLLYKGDDFKLTDVEAAI